MDFFGVLSVNTVGRCATSYLLAGLACLWCLVVLHFSLHEEFFLGQNLASWHLPKEKKHCLGCVAEFGEVLKNWKKKPRLALIFKLISVFFFASRNFITWWQRNREALNPTNFFLGKNGSKLPYFEGKKGVYKSPYLYHSF